jgi:hypothetical protein
VAVASIVVHTHPGSYPFRVYLLWYFAEHWRRAGHRVDVIAGPWPVPGAHIAILHVDLTRVPAEYAALRDAYPVLLNGAVRDIGKRRLGALTGVEVAREDAYDGPVIVKTDLNARGIPERLARRAGQSRVARLWDRVLDHAFPRRPTGRLWHRRYPVFRDRRAVPGWVWRRADLVVHRWMPEPAPEGGYVTRSWRFLGDRTWDTRRLNPGPHFTKGTGAGVTVPGTPAPPELPALRTALGFDFGKFDYVIHQGRPVVLDVNHTPGDIPATGLPREAIPWLAEGLARWLP